MAGMGAEFGEALGVGAGLGNCVSERLTVMRLLSSESAGTFGRGSVSPKPETRWVLEGAIA